jgi:hypothetical protein
VNWTKGSHGLSFGGSVKTINQQTILTSDFNFPTVGLGGNFRVQPWNATAANALRPANLNTRHTRNAYDSALTFLLGTSLGGTRFNYDSAGTLCR